jgi:hypothetical protein
VRGGWIRGGWCGFDVHHWIGASMKLTEIVFETNRYSIVRVTKGFEVYEIGATAAKRCTVIGYEGDKGLQRAKLEVERREAR